MSNQPLLTFEPEVLYKQAQGNANAIAWLAIAFAKERGLLDEFIDYMGARMAQTWEPMQGASAEEIVKMMAMNFVSIGGELRALTGDESEAEAVVAGWPDQEMLTFSGISQAEADRTLAWFDDIAASLGVNFRAQRQGDAITLRIYR
jgi:hypothetical protein